MSTLKKRREPLFPSGAAVAITSFSYAGGVVNVGDEYPSDHALVTGNPAWFCDAATPVKERPNIWTEMPPPPEHKRFTAPTAPIPPHRQVRSLVDTWTSMPWAPGSTGSKGGIMPPPVGGGLLKGRVYDLLDPVVRANPQFFEFGRRDVTLEDIERAEAEEARANGQ